MENTDFQMEKFDAAVINGTATWWQMDLPSGNVFFGAQKANMLGYPDSNFKTYMDFIKLVHPEDSEKAMQAMRELLEGKTRIYEIAYRIKSQTGEYIKFYDYGQITKKEGDQISIMGFVLKIDDNVNALEQMKGFKELVLMGNPSILDLVSKIR